MIKFFRRIRQSLLSEGKLKKYFFYAIGEILLVVIGILIALQINNWNEGRKNAANEIILIKNIIEDLRLDSIHISLAIKQVGEQMSVLDKLNSKALDEDYIMSFDSVALVRYSSDFRPLVQRNHSVSVSNLGNELVREKIQNYFLEEDQVSDMFSEYEEVIHDNIRPYLRKVGMHNLQSLYDKRPDFIIENLLDHEILVEQLNNVTFQQLLFERRLKTDAFQFFLLELQEKNEQLIETLSKHNE